MKNKYNKWVLCCIYIVGIIMIPGNVYADKPTGKKTETVAEKRARPITQFITASQYFNIVNPAGKAFIEVSGTLESVSGMSERTASILKSTPFDTLPDAAAFLVNNGWTLVESYAIGASQKSKVVWVFSKTVLDTDDFLKGFPK